MPQRIWLVLDFGLSDGISHYGRGITGLCRLDVAKVLGLTLPHT